MYGFQNTSYKAPPPYFTGAIGQLLTQRMNADFAEINQTWSFAYYRRISIDGINPIHLTFQIPDDYYYHLDELRAKWVGQDDPGANTLNWQLRQVGRNREFSPRDIPINLQTTPGSKNRLRYTLKANHTFFPSDKVLLVIRGDETADNRELDIVLTGLRIPKDFIIQE